MARWRDRFVDLTIVTQNIDGRHAAAAGSKDVIELYGNINRSRCGSCDLKFEMKRDVLPHKPEKCSNCGSKLSPDVVLFGEMLPEGAFEQTMIKASFCNLFFIVGTSTLVYPAAILPEIARSGGAFLIEINPENTPLTEICDSSLQGKASAILHLFKL